MSAVVNTAQPLTFGTFRVLVIAGVAAFALGALSAFVASLRLGGFPDIDNLHASRWQVLPILAALFAMAETVRCMHRKWTLYQAGVLILLYTDVMIMGLAVFLFFYP